MPRENRKRGKKHKKSATNEEDYNHIDVPVIAEEEPQQEAGPSWITRAPNPNEDREAPFGYVDSEVKAYFRTVDVQIREWQEVQDIEEDTGDSDPNEGMFNYCRTSTRSKIFSQTVASSLWQR